MIISRSVVLLALSAGLLPAAADLRMGRRHLQGTVLESNVTDTASVADVIVEEDGKKKEDAYKNEVAKRSATYQYVNAESILKGIYGEVPASRTGGKDSGITFTEALRYSELNKCFLTPIRDDLELLEVQTALQIALETSQVPVFDPMSMPNPRQTFAWVGVSKDASLTTTSPEPDEFLGQRLCRAGNWKNLFDGSDLGGYESGPYMDCASNCPGGCWLSEVSNRITILNDYWFDDGSLPEGEPDNGADNMMRYNKLETKAMMKAKDKRLYDTHGGNIVAARGAIYMCKVEMEK